MAGRKRASRFRVKRLYDAADADDGVRILVDRVWPRGRSRESLDIADWMKEIAPSTELRKWFDHDQKKWTGFRIRYFAELEKNADLTDNLRVRAKTGRVTLLFGARYDSCNNAVALKAWLDREEP